MKLSFERLLRRINLWWRKRNKIVIVFRNATNEKLFIVREKNDFALKKALRLKPNQVLSVVIKSFKNGIIIRNVEREILLMYKPVFEVVINEGDGPDHYEIEEFD